MIAIIVAVGQDNCIGSNNQLPWHLPEDLEHFKNLTTGKIILMGRKTWESLPDKFKPLPNRTNVVISRNEDYHLPKEVELFKSIDSALEAHKDEDVMIIGGGGIYNQSISLCDTLFITEVNQKVKDCDTWFPEIINDKWEEIDRKDHTGYSFVTYKKS